MSHVPSRLTSAVLLGAAVLAVSWVSAPASPVAPPPRVSMAELADVESLAPVAQEIDQEVERLRARLSISADAAAPARDPFSFGRVSRPTIRPEAPAAPVTIEASTVPIAPEVAWPTLAAVMADKDGPTAVVAWGDTLELLKPGESFKDFFVVSVSTSGIDVRHEPTKTTRTLTLR